MAIDTWTEQTLRQSGDPLDAIAFRLRLPVADIPLWAIRAFVDVPLSVVYPELPDTDEVSPERERERSRLVELVLAFRGWRLLRRLCGTAQDDFLVLPDAALAARRLVQHFGPRAVGLFDLQVERVQRQWRALESLAAQVLAGPDPVPLAEDGAYPEVAGDLLPLLPLVLEPDGSGESARFLKARLLARKVTQAVHDLGINLPDTALPPGFVDFLWRHRRSTRWDELVPVWRIWPAVPPDVRALPLRELHAKLHAFRAAAAFEDQIASNQPNAARWEAAQAAPHYMPGGTPVRVALPKLPALQGTFLARSDRRGPVLGELTGCCQNVSGPAGDCAWHGQTDPLGGFFVVEDGSGCVMAQSWVWRDRTGRALCYDSIECLAGYASRPKLAAGIALAILRSGLWCLGQDFGYGEPVSLVLVGPSNRLPVFASLAHPVRFADLSCGPVVSPEVGGSEWARSPCALFATEARSATALAARDRLMSLDDPTLLEMLSAGHALIDLR